MKLYIYSLATMLLTTSLYAAKGHGGVDWNILGGSIFNFVLFIMIIVFMAKKPVKQALKKRKEDMEAEINKYKIEKEAAEAKLKEYEEKLSNIDLKIAEVKLGYEEAFVLKRDALNKKNKEDIKRLELNYERELEARIQSLHNELKAELMDNAINLAQNLIVEKFDKDSKAELEFIKNFKIES